MNLRKTSRTRLRIPATDSSTARQLSAAQSELVGPGTAKQCIRAAAQLLFGGTEQPQEQKGILQLHSSPRCLSQPTNVIRLTIRLRMEE